MLIEIKYLEQNFENSLEVGLLGHCALTAECPGSIPGSGAKILRAMGEKKKKSTAIGYLKETYSESFL